MQNVGSDIEDSFGLINISGNGNSILSNHISVCVDLNYNEEFKPNVIYISNGSDNLISTNHIVATFPLAKQLDSKEDACCNAQVGAILNAGSTKKLCVNNVVIDSYAISNIILDTGYENEIIADRNKNNVRAFK
jgi:hypothetical protein